MTRSRGHALTTVVTLLALLGVAAAAPPAPDPCGHHGPPRSREDHEKGNWAGYEALGAIDEFHDVEARWRQPAAMCASGRATYATFWVGLDGARPEEGDNTVEQTGTGAWCAPDGRVEYYAWYELFPTDIVDYNDPVRPGDQLQAEVRALSHDCFELFLRDFTQKWTQITYARHPPRDTALLNCAEVIAEAPGPRSTLLTDFGSVRFTDSLVNMRPLGSLNHRSVTMVTPDRRTARAVPGPLTRGKDFSVDWEDY